MTLKWVNRLMREDLPLTQRIEATNGFHIDGYEFPSFSPLGQNEMSSISEDGVLKVITSIQAVGDSFVVKHTIENLSEQLTKPIYQIQPLKLIFNIPGTQWRHMYANGGTFEFYYPPKAFQIQEHSRSEETFRIESHKGGRSSDLHLPLLMSMASQDTNSDGLFCGMEWSGGWYIEHQGLVKPKETEYSLAHVSDQSQLTVGIKVNGMQLQPGEILSLPAVQIGFFSGGHRAGTQVLRKHLHENVCAQYHNKPMIPIVSYDHWFGIDNELNETLMREQAKRAAELGVETFVVDASWFPGDFPYGAGNWEQVDEKKFPQGLDPLADYVRELGMGFGLWFEPERACQGSILVERNPEWFIVKEEGKNEFLMNLALKDVQDYLIEMIGGWIQRLKLVWIRWDFNVEPQGYWDKIDPTLKYTFHYVEGLYRVLDTLIEKYPDLMIEGCAGGGRRIDLGTIRRSHTLWFSDHSKDPWICRYMQARANRFLPGHLLNSSVAVGRRQGDAQFNDVAVLSRMMGKLAFDGDIASWSPELTITMEKWSAHFKSIRHLLVQDFYQLTSIPTASEDGDAVQFTSYSGDEAVIFIFSGSDDMKMSIPLYGLDSEQSYEIRYLSSDKVEEKSLYGNGLEWMREGLKVDLPANQASLIHCRLSERT
ncbi:glycoside hydrolase family 36 protein [Cohnella abietis]|uniref:Alpha-galactosidase n=1 Tax=Cohnella abietis TaxID=2507935 RepID=A0A3T1D0B7_9BACL|nr:glycoside hydrolase family 36 protein [Cohnella abietis]BBI31542.1 alpha-galactosidase [Cohnella abietis]